MTYDQARTRFAVLLVAEEITINPIISTTDRDALLMEAYLEMGVAFNTAGSLGAGFAKSGSDFSVTAANWGVATSVLAVDAMEVQVGSNFVPLMNAPILAIQKLVAGEGANGTPRQWGMGLVSITLATNTSVHQVAVYPIPLASETYRGIVISAPAELVNGTDVLFMDEPMAEYTVRLAVARAAETLGYDLAFVDSLLSPLSDGLMQAVAYDSYVRRTAPRGEGRRVGEDKEKHPIGVRQ